MRSDIDESDSTGPDVAGGDTEYDAVGSGTADQTDSVGSDDATSDADESDSIGTDVAGAVTEYDTIGSDTDVETDAIGSDVLNGSTFLHTKFSLSRVHRAAVT